MHCSAKAMSEQSEVNAPKQRLLFVEDEATLREHLAERLSDEYVVDTAGNGNDALLAVMRAKPALVVTDIVMPDMDGVELLKTLRQTPGTRSIPVLLISGRAPEAQRIEGFEEGADGFLAKPYTERELRALIGSMLRSAQLRTAAGRNAREQAEQKAVIEQSRLLQHALAELRDREEQLRESQRQVSHLEHLVDDLLDISRITRGSVELRREKILLTEVLASAVESSRPHIDAQAHKLVIDARPTVPVIIEGDRQRLAQIFANLLANSAKYTDREGTITLTLDCQGSEAVVSVRDTGIGVPPHALEQVFEMFSRVAPGDARSERGPGIGLALVRALTQLHGGSVSASSQGPGTGSVFTVRLPVVQNTSASTCPRSAVLGDHAPFPVR